MLAWKVPSCFQYSSTRSSIAGNLGVDGTAELSLVDTLGYVIGGFSCDFGGSACRNHRDDRQTAVPPCLLPQEPLVDGCDGPTRPVLLSPAECSVPFFRRLAADDGSSACGSSLAGSGLPPRRRAGRVEP